MSEDIINHPKHYEAARFTCEPADLTVLMPHPIASAIEYIVRAPYKGSEETDLRKAAWWLNRALATPYLWHDSTIGTILTWAQEGDGFFDMAAAAGLCTVTPRLRELFTFHEYAVYVRKEDVINLAQRLEDAAFDLHENELLTR